MDDLVSQERSTTSVSAIRRHGSSAEANTMAELRGWSAFVALRWNTASSSVRLNVTLLPWLKHSG